MRRYIKILSRAAAFCVSGLLIFFSTVQVARADFGDAVAGAATLAGAGLLIPGPNIVLVPLGAVLGAVLGFFGVDFSGVATGVGLEIVEWLAGAISTIISFVAQFFFIAANGLVDFAIELNTLITESAVTREGFTISLNVANLGLVAVIIVVAFMVMLRRGEASKLLTKLIVIALIMNFSFYLVSAVMKPVDAITTTLHDAANITIGTFQDTFDLNELSDAIEILTGDATNTTSISDIPAGDFFSQEVEDKMDSNIEAELMREVGGVGLNWAEGIRLEITEAFKDKNAGILNLEDFDILGYEDSFNEDGSIISEKCNEGSVVPSSTAPAAGIGSCRSETCHPKDDYDSFVDKSTDGIHRYLLGVLGREDLEKRFGVSGTDDTNGEICGNISAGTLANNLTDYETILLRLHYAGESAILDSMSCKTWEDFKENVESCSAELLGSDVDTISGGLLGGGNSDAEKLAKIGAQLAGVIFFFAFNAIGILALLAVAVAFFVRYIAISILIILLPLALLASVIPKDIKLPGGNLFELWSSTFMKWLIFGPFMMFFFFLSARAANVITDIAPEPTSSDPGVLAVGAIGNMLVVVGLMIGGLIAGKKLGITGSDFALNGIKKASKNIRKGVSGYVGGRAKLYGTRAATAPLRTNLGRTITGGMQRVGKYVAPVGVAGNLLANARIAGEKQYDDAKKRLSKLSLEEQAKRAGTESGPGQLAIFTNINGEIKKLEKKIAKATSDADKGKGGGPDPEDKARLAALETSMRMVPKHARANIDRLRTLYGQNELRPSKGKAEELVDAIKEEERESIVLPSTPPAPGTGGLTRL